MSKYYLFSISSSFIPFTILFYFILFYLFIFFSIDRIHEIAQFAQIWTDPIFGGKHFIVRRKVIREAQDNQEQKQDEPGKSGIDASGDGNDDQGKKVEKVLPNFIFDSGFNTLSVKAKMGEWVGVMKFKVSSFKTSVYLANEKGLGFPCAMARGDVRKIAFTSEGKLSGSGKTDGISFWSYVDGRSYELKGYTELLPFAATFDYELTQSLALNCKSFAGSFVSTGRTVSALVRSNGMTVHISPQTIATAITIFSKLYTCVTDQIAIFKHSTYTVPWASEKKQKKENGKGKRNSALWRYNGDLGLEITDFSVWIFESTKDDTWFEFKIGTSSIKFKIEQSGGKSVVRDLIVDGRSIFFSLDHEVKPIKKGSEPGNETDKKPKKAHTHSKKDDKADEPQQIRTKKTEADPWQRENYTTKILEMPDGRLIMHTEKDSPSASNLNVWFNTEFSQPIYVSLDVRLYTQLRDLAMFYKTRISDEMERLSSATDLGMIFSGLSKKDTQKDTEPKAQKNTVYVQKLFKLEPVLNVLSDLTPSVSTVLGWAGIESPSETIPRVTHEKISLSIERVLRILIMFWNDVQSYISDKKALDDQI